MRLMFIDFSLPYLLRDANYAVGGSAVEISTFVDALTGAGHAVAVLSWKGANAYVGRDLKFELLDTYDPRAGIPVARYVYSHIPKVVEAARAFRPDVFIQTVRGLQTAVVGCACVSLRIPMVYRVASDADVDERCGVGVGLIDRLAYSAGIRFASLFLCQNRYQSDTLHARFAHIPCPIVHNPVRLPAKSPSSLPLSKREYVAWLGNFRQAKNLPLLLRVALELPTTKFKIGGLLSSTADRQTIVAVDELRTLKNVEFAGHVKRCDVPDFLSRASALLCTSDFEGFSNAFLEALVVGTPVVARTCVDPDGIIGSNNLGKVCGSGSELARSLREILSIPYEMYDALASRCQSYVRKFHAPEAKARELVDVIASLLLGWPNART